MYKFEISADSPHELREKMMEFANELHSNEMSTISKLTEKPEYIDEVEEVSPVPTFVQPYAVAPQGFPPPYVGPSATTVDLPTPPVISPQAENDSRGFKWDVRIHSTAKSFNKDGTWRVKRGVDEALVQQIEAELSGKQSIAGIPFVPPPPPQAVMPVDLPKFDLNIKVTPQGQPTANPWETSVQPAAVPAQAQPVAVTPAYENIPAPTTTRPAHGFATFKANLTLLLAQLINEKKIDQAYIKSLCDYFQIKDIWNVLGNERQLIELYNMFGEVGFITKMD